MTSLRRQFGIDVFFVHTMAIPGRNQFLNGGTVYKRLADANQLGIVIAVFDNITSTKRRSNAELAKTLAHELTHYLTNMGDESHNVGNDEDGASKPHWNLFAGGDTGSQIRLDLTEDDRILVDDTLNPVLPDWSNNNE